MKAGPREQWDVRLVRSLAGDPTGRVPLAELAGMTDRQLWDVWLDRPEAKAGHAADAGPAVRVGDDPVGRANADSLLRELARVGWLKKGRAEELGRRRRGPEGET